MEYFLFCLTTSAEQILGRHFVTNNNVQLVIQHCGQISVSSWAAVCHVVRPTLPPPPPHPPPDTLGLTQYRICSCRMSIIVRSSSLLPTSAFHPHHQCSALLLWTPAPAPSRLRVWPWCDQSSLWCQCQDHSQCLWAVRHRAPWHGCDTAPLITSQTKLQLKPSRVESHFSVYRPWNSSIEFPR